MPVAKQLRPTAMWLHPLKMHRRPRRLLQSQQQRMTLYLHPQRAGNALLRGLGKRGAKGSRTSSTRSSLGRRRHQSASPRAMIPTTTMNSPGPSPMPPGLLVNQITVPFVGSASQSQHTRAMRRMGVSFAPHVEGSSPKTTLPPKRSPSDSEMSRAAGRCSPRSSTAHTIQGQRA